MKKEKEVNILAIIGIGILVVILGIVLLNVLKDNKNDTPSVTYTKGKIIGNTYLNEWADISIVFPTTYSNASEDMYTASENETTDCCMYFVELSGANMMILAEDISAAPSITEKKYIENVVKSLDEKMTSAYFPYEASVTVLSENKSVEIAGYTYSQLSYQIDLSLDPMYLSVFQNMYLRKIGNRMLAIATTTDSLEEAEALISLIGKYEEYERNTEINTETSTQVGNSEVEYQASPNLSNDIDSFQVQVMDYVYQFPMNYDEFVATGWKVYEKYTSITEELKPGVHELVWFEKNGMLMNCYVFNPDISVQTIEGCVISGIAQADASYNNGKNIGVFIPGGFEVGVATKAEVLAAFREPDKVYDSDTRSSVTFTTDNVYASTELSFDANGILYDISVENPVAPENYQYSTADTTYVAPYTVPTSMGSLITDRIVNFDGDLYQLPVTVNALMENGWTTTAVHEVVRSSGSFFIDIERNGKSFHVPVYNYYHKAVEVNQCYIQELVSSYSLSQVQLEISGGIHMQMTEDELKTILANAGMEYSVENYNEEIVYGFVFGEDTVDNYVRVYFQEGIVKKIKISAGKEWRQ